MDFFAKLTSLTGAKKLLYYYNTTRPHAQPAFLPVFAAAGRIGTRGGGRMLPQPVEYVLIAEEGPDHNKSFTVEARVNGRLMGTGTGHTKKAAEQAAAYQAIREIKK